jgi:hypothetical protein
MAALFSAGAAGDVEDEGHKNYAGAECWELLNMRNVSTSRPTLSGRNEAHANMHPVYSLNSSSAIGLTHLMLRRSIRGHRWFTRFRGTCDGDIVSFMYVIVIRKIDHIGPVTPGRLRIVLKPHAGVFLSRNGEDGQEC